MTSDLGMTSVGRRMGRTPMARIEKTLRVLVVDDDRDATGSLGLLVEELGIQAYVTFGGTRLVSPRRPPLPAFESR
jgi:hypothetical protein